MKKRSSPFSRPRVALLIESSRAYGRTTLLGVARYIREHSPWSISFQELNLCDDVPVWFESWKGDGIIARMQNAEIAGVIRKLGVPAVSLVDLMPDLKMPSVITDNAAAGTMAFEHLKERGFRHFAFCGFNGADYSDVRRDGFSESVRSAGFQCHIFGAEEKSSAGSTAQAEAEGIKDGERVARWIKELPKPVGLMACNDLRGQEVLNACRAAGVAVPDEAAVMGVDNDEVLCGLADPPLSSVIPSAELIGYEAAALLDRMMNGKKPKRERFLFRPVGIVTRRSTEVLAIDDRQIAAAARFIREHACEGIDVGDVMKAVHMSRSTLERHYEKTMGFSVKHEILRVRLNRAKQLLAETDFSLAEIAEKIGFEHTEYLSVIFKKKVGVTPAKFRVQSRMAEGQKLEVRS